MARPTLDEIFNSSSSDGRPSLDEIFNGDQISNSKKVSQPSFPIGNTPFERNIVDPFLMAGTEIARGYNRGSAAMLTPLAYLGKAIGAQDANNLPEQARQYFDRQAEALPPTTLDPASKFLFSQVAELPGQVAAFEQVAPVLKPLASLAVKIPSAFKGGGLKALNESAGNVVQNMKNVQEMFSEQYNKLFSKIGEKTVPVESLADSVKSASKILTSGGKSTSLVDDLVSKYTNSPSLTDLLENKGGTITANQLHNLRQEITSIVPTRVLLSKTQADVESRALKQLYDVSGKLLTDLGGEEYSSLTSRFHDFQKNVASYIKRYSVDANGNPTGQYLKNFRKLPFNASEAFNRLDQMTANPIVPDIRAINRARDFVNTFKKPSTYGIAGLGAEGFNILRRH